MAKKDVYNTIIVSQEPRGRFFDGYISGTPMPGTVMQLKAATEPVSGRHTWEAFDRGGDAERPQGPIVVLLENHLEGGGIDVPYENGKMGHLYCPLPGDELLMRLGDVSGTGDSHAIGEILIIDDGTGELIATTGTPETEPFVCLETLAAPTEDTHVHAMFTGY